MSHNNTPVLASDWSILTMAKLMHPAIRWGVRLAHRDTQSWRLSLGIILPGVKICHRSQAPHGNFHCHNGVGFTQLLKKPRQLSCKATLVFLAAW